MLPFYCQQMDWSLERGWRRPRSVLGPRVIRCTTGRNGMNSASRCQGIRRELAIRGGRVRQKWRGRIERSEEERWGGCSRGVLAPSILLDGTWLELRSVPSTGAASEETPPTMRADRTLAGMPTCRRRMRREVRRRRSYGGGADDESSDCHERASLFRPTLLFRGWIGSC